MQKGLDFFCSLWYYYIVIFMISATDGISGFNHGGTEINIADRLGSLFPYGISVPFFIFGDFY